MFDVSTDLQALYAFIKLLDGSGTQQQALNALIFEAPCDGKLRHCTTQLVRQLGDITQLFLLPSSFLRLQPFLQPRVALHREYSN